MSSFFRARRLGALRALLVSALVASHARAYVAIIEPPASPAEREAGAALTVVEHLAEAVTQLWSTDDGLRSIVTLALAQTHEGLLWAGTERGLAHFDGRTWTTVIDRSAVNTLQRIGRELWVGTSEGLARVVDGQVDLKAADGPLPRGAVRALAADGPRPYAGTARGDLVAVEGDRIVWRRSAADGLPAEAITRLLVAGDRVVVGTERGLRMIHRASGAVRVVEGFLGGATITGLAQDGASLLVATFDQGLFRCDDERCEAAQVTGLEVGTHLVQPLVLGDQTLLLPTAAALVVVRANRLVGRYPELAGSLTSLLRDRDGTLWAGTGNDGRLGGLRSLASSQPTTPAQVARRSSCPTPGTRWSSMSTSP